MAATRWWAPAIAVLAGVLAPAATLGGCTLFTTLDDLSGGADETPDSARPSTPPCSTCDGGVDGAGGGDTSPPVDGASSSWTPRKTRQTRTPARSAGIVPLRSGRGRELRGLSRVTRALHHMRLRRSDLHSVLRGGGRHMPQHRPGSLQQRLPVRGRRRHLPGVVPGRLSRGQLLPYLRRAAVVRGPVQGRRRLLWHDVHVTDD